MDSNLIRILEQKDFCFLWGVQLAIGSGLTLSAVLRAHFWQCSGTFGVSGIKLGFTKCKAHICIFLQLLKAFFLQVWFSSHFFSVDIKDFIITELQFIYEVVSDHPFWGWRHSTKVGRLLETPLILVQFFQDPMSISRSNS